ncbi:hypothetical protein MMC12_007352 [Toensbergia leucococca]|nr:hypothetical protein [Toensbergia leucococca]
MLAGTQYQNELTSSRGTHRNGLAKIQGMSRSIAVRLPPSCIMQDVQAAPENRYKEKNIEDGADLPMPDAMNPIVSAATLA